MNKIKRDGVVNVRVNKSLREQAELILMNYGLTVGDCVNIMINQVIRTGGVPFEMKPNLETQKAIDLVMRAEEAGDTTGLSDYEFQKAQS